MKARVYIVKITEATEAEKVIHGILEKEEDGFSEIDFRLSKVSVLFGLIEDEDGKFIDLVIDGFRVLLDYEEGLYKAIKKELS
jgi:hypothetical protein